MERGNDYEKIVTDDCLGLPMLPNMQLEHVKSISTMKPRAEDIFVVTYPRSGTTWMTYIVWEILHNGEPLPAADDMVHRLAPFLDIVGVEGVEYLEPPRVMRIHLPYHLAPVSLKAKYIYVTRNPYDCCVSLYHFAQNMKSIYKFDGNFDDFFENFYRGNIPYGDYFDHLLSWFEHRRDPNVFFVSYEDMKINHEAVVCEVADFLETPVKHDKKLVDKIVKNTEFSSLKSAHKVNISKLLLREESEKKEISLNYFRKGEVGDWKNFFNQEQKRLLDEMVAQRLNAIDITTLWHGAM
ncbi:estrogen sulfotransferase-like [Limulus polyphemus]|uniref:Estrogen sulfotransferase-like n=1 Tax=Limulus polyphemus TaxID=6850 RepID=A0ABM1B7A7_LIMPO|nr:estrogen sulfotransferase-like [Limulus polyphemus]